MIDAIVDGLEEHPERSMTVAFQHAGGSIGRVATDATAFAHRYVKHDTLLLMAWPVGIDPTDHIRRKRLPGSYLFFSPSSRS